MHCKRFRPQPLSRRDLLKGSGIGFGAFALDALLMRNASASNGKGMIGTHHEVKAKSIIFLYMDGGVSHVDSFDPKPLLKEHNGKDPSKFFKVAPTQFNNNGKILASPWGFKKYGKSGIPISDLFPNIAKHADKLAVAGAKKHAVDENTSPPRR